MAKVMQFSLPECSIVKRQYSEKNGRTYLTIMDGENEFNINAGECDVSSLPLMKPVKLEGTLSGFVFNRAQLLTLQSIKVTPI